MCGSPLCRKCQRGASFGRRARPVLTRQPSSVDCRRTHLAVAGRPAEAPWGGWGGRGGRNYNHRLLQARRGRMWGSRK